MQVPRLYRHGDKYNRASVGDNSRGQQSNQSAISRPTHPIRVYPLIRSLARSLAPAPANTPDCTPSVFKQTRTPLSPPLSALPCLLPAPFLSALLSSFTPLPLVSLFCFAIRELQSFAFSFLNARSGREKFLNRIIRFNRARFRSLSPRHHPPLSRS